MKQTCLCLARVSGTQTNPLVVSKYAQTRKRRLRGKVVKKLVTAGTIKGPLTCPEKRIEKQSVFTE